MRGRLFLLLGAFCAISLNCTTQKTLPIDTQVDDPVSALRKPAGLKIIGYVTTDGTYHSYPGSVRLQGADSLSFQLDPTARPKEQVPRQMTQAVSDVTSLQIRKTKVLATVGVLALVTAAVVATIVILGNASDEPEPPPTTTTSCPLLYSWDGTQYVLDAEPYGGAIAKGLERTDYTELESLVESDGTYRIVMTNEMEEVQHTNRLDLVVADAPTGSEVAIDADGEVHAFRKTLGPLRATDQRGNDLLPWLGEKDYVVWHPPLAAAADAPPADLRDHLMVEFERPLGAQRAYLLADVATAPWGAYTLKHLLEMRGFALAAFYAAINHSAGARRDLREWNDREELFHLGVEVEEGGRWVRQDVILGGGPVIAETRLVPLDLSRVQGSRVRVRVNPPIGFWMVNAFRLAYEEEPVRTRVVTPAVARDQADRDVRRLILADDAATLDFPTNDDWALITFPAPHRSPNTQRRIFARTRGWYDIRLDAASLPDWKRMERVTREPGYVTRFALEDYRSR